MLTLLNSVVLWFIIHHLLQIKTTKTMSKVYPQWFDVSLADLMNRGLIVELIDDTGEKRYKLSSEGMATGMNVLDDIYKCKSHNVGIIFILSTANADICDCFHSRMAN
jgi:hypothetical protein